MIVVSEIWPEVKKIMGSARDDVSYLRLTHAVELLANKGDWDPMIGFVDICTEGGTIVTLPREVETILGLNLGKTPALGRDRLYTFHLNGPGDDCPLEDNSWQDLGDAPTYRELACPAKLVAMPTLEVDDGAELWVYGFDINYQVVRTEISPGVFVDGYQVPVIFDHPVPASDAPVFRRITRVRKALTKGSIRLSSIDNSTGTGTLIGIFEHDETEPIYRRIKLSRETDWVRICYRRRTYKISSQESMIPLHNAQAIIMMLRALKYYDDPPDFATATSCEATALRWLEEEQYTRTPPVTHPIQVTGPTIADEASEVV
jgi:hypothetical protein